jgi:hypothetical protein
MAGLFVSPFTPALALNGIIAPAATLTFYATGTSTPQNVYADSGLATSLGSVITANAQGQFVAIYLAGTPLYRAVLKTSLGAVLGDIDPITETTLTQLALSNGATLVGVKQPDANASTQTVTSKLSQGLHAEDFRYNTDGTSRTDTQTLTYAFAAWMLRGGGSLTLGQNRTYALGSYSFVGITEIFPLTGLRNAVLDCNGAFITLTSTATGVRPFLFPLRDYQNVTIKNLKVQDYGTDVTVNWRGVYVICPLGDVSNKSGFNLTLDNINVASAVAFLNCGGTLSAIEGITVLPNCQASSCYYGLSFQEAGNSVTATLLTTDCLRSYFPYGVRRHVVTINCIHSVGTPGAEAMCLIKRYQLDTGDIDLTIAVTGSTEAFDNIVKIEHQPTSGVSTISNISIHYKLDPALAMAMTNAACTLFNQPLGSKTKPLTLSSYLTGGTEETVTTANIWRKIVMSGNISMAPGDHVVARVKPTTPADISIMPGLGLNPYRCNTKGGIVFKTGNGRDFITRIGDVTASPFEVDLSGFDNTSSQILVGVSALGHVSGTAAQNQSRYSWNVFFQMPTGGPLSIQGNPQSDNFIVGTALTFSSFTVSGKKLLLTFSGAGYTNTDTLMVVDVTYRDQLQS